MAKYNIEQFRIGKEYTLSDDRQKWVCVGEDHGTLLLAIRDPEDINCGLIKHIPFMDIEKVEENRIQLNRTDTYLIYPLHLDGDRRLGKSALTGSQLKQILDESEEIERVK